MAALQNIRINSSNLDEIVCAVRSVYCPNTTLFERPSGPPRGLFAIRYAGLQPVVDIRYGTRATVGVGEFPRLLFMRTCVDGSGTATQQGISIALRRGETVPMSAGFTSTLQIDAQFAQRSVKLDFDRVESHCARMLNHPLDRPLRFELRPFSASLERAWAEAVRLMTSYANMDLVLPQAARASLDEFIISLVLNKHPHNYTDELSARARALPPRLIREAEYLMTAGGRELTVSQIAARLRVSLRSLDRGFREHRGMTPSQQLRTLRLERVRAILRDPQLSTTVTSAALECGFVHLARFSAHYKAAFGELPAQTLRRSRVTRPDPSSYS